METTYDGTTEQARAAGRRLKNDLSEGVNHIKATASSEIKNLIADVEELMARIVDLKDADVVRVRGVRDSPWQAVGIAALVGAVVGILATRRS